MFYILPLFETVHASHHFIQLAEAELSHDMAQVLGHKEEIVDHVFGLSLELLAQIRILCGHAHGAGVEVAFAHHDAAHGNERCAGESEFLRSKERGDGDVAAGLKLSVHLHANAAAQIVHHQHLLSLGEAELPGNPGVTDGTDGRSSSAAVITAD